MADDAPTNAAIAAASDETKAAGNDAAIDSTPTGTDKETPAKEPDQSEEKKSVPDKVESIDSNATKDSDGDKKTTDATNASTSASTTAPAANGTPAATEKKSEKSRRKSGGVPEHKSKKNKSKKQAKETNLDAQPGQLFLARMKGHPAWPSIIADDEMLPEAISKARPVTAPNADGTWRREDYAPGGKRHSERTFAIMFLFTNEFAWIPNTDLQPLTVDDCKEVSEKNKSKNLLEAYREASEGHDLEHYKGLLNEHANAIAEEEEARAAREAEKARKAEKKAKRESKVADDEMDVDDDGAESKPKSKKRKKEAGDDEDEKPAKTLKTTKLRLSVPKTPGANEKSGKKKEASAKPAKKKSAAKLNGSDDDASTPAAEAKILSPEEAHDKLKEEIRYCRHKLQRTLLSRDTFPSDDEVKNCEPYLAKLEKHPDLPADIIAVTKIHKVLKNIIKLPPIPLDEQFSFKKRSVELLSKWNKILADNPQAADKKDGDKKESRPSGDENGEEHKKSGGESPDDKGDEKTQDGGDTANVDSQEKPEETSDEKSEEASKNKPASEESKPAAENEKSVEDEAAEKVDAEVTKKTEAVGAAA